jgi:hypothetical protein
MNRSVMTPLERQFLTLSARYLFDLDDLALVFEMPRQQAQKVLYRAQAKDARACERLLRAIEGVNR